MELAGRHAVLPQRIVLDASTLPDIQFDIGAFSAAPVTLNDGGGTITAAMPPLHTVFVTAKLNRTPTRADQHNLSNALATIEAAYPFSAAAIITFIAYGIPYFNRLPGALTGSLVSSHMPRLLSDTSRFALEEAVPAPTDVSSANPGITKQTFNVPVTIESNDLLITVRGDNSSYISDVLNWLGGSNTLKGNPVTSPSLFRDLATVTSSRAQFVGISLPRLTAADQGFSYADEINPDSPMWMGFLDQQTNGAGPAAITTFAGNASARLTTAKAGDYFDNGSIQHLSHVIEDLAQFSTPRRLRPEGRAVHRAVQYMSGPTRSRPSAIPTSSATAAGRATSPTPSRASTTRPTTRRTLTRSTASTGWATWPACSARPEPPTGRLCTSGWTNPAWTTWTCRTALSNPSSSSRSSCQRRTFRLMRVNQASLDLVQQFGVDPGDTGLERFLTATRRQNFLIPPRRNRAFPLVELA